MKSKIRGSTARRPLRLRAAAWKIAQQHLHLTAVAARKFCVEEHERADCEQEALFGLFRAAQIFDHRKGVPFRAYAMQKMRGAILSYLYPRRIFRHRDFEALLEHEAPGTIDGKQEGREDSLRRVVAALSPRERAIIQRRFGMGRRGVPQTQRSIARGMNVHPSLICVIEKRVLRKLPDLVIAQLRSERETGILRRRPTRTRNA